MAVLEEFQFELDNYVFGHRRPIFVDQDGFDPGDDTVLEQDQINPINGSRVMGRDVPSAGTWTFSMHVDQEDPETALAELANLAKIWRNGSTGFQTGRTVKMLRYNLAGRTRVVFGRPRRFSAKPNNRLLGGYLPPLATFDLSDSLHYDDVADLVDLVMVPDVSGGFAFPASFPITFTRDPDAEAPGAITIGGDAATNPVVTFYGPILNPGLTIGTFKLGLSGSIGEGGSVTVDTRPWAQTITRAGDTSGVKLSRDTRLVRASLRPGTYSALFRGVDTTGQSRCRILWRNAWHSL